MPRVIAAAFGGWWCEGGGRCRAGRHGQRQGAKGETQHHHAAVLACTGKRSVRRQARLRGSSRMQAGDPNPGFARAFEVFEAFGPNTVNRDMEIPIAIAAAHWRVDAVPVVLHALIFGMPDGIDGLDMT